MRARPKARLRCIKCFGNHRSDQCPLDIGASDLPFETPPHNGEYQGTCEVRVVPAGEFGINPTGRL